MPASSGCIGVDAPEEFGGVGLDKAAALVVSRYTSGSASFSSTFGAQSNLALSAILYFGTHDQKTRYLPKLISGELVGAYALSESGSGSDALSASTRAARTSDGGFALTGEKMWITNGGFADVFIVFAKVDGEHFTAFIVERGFRGVSTGNEEHKMGLHGSSTTPLILQDVRVPAAQPARRDRQGPQGGVQRAELRPLQARRHVRRGRLRRHPRKCAICGGAPAVRKADRRVRRHQAQARRDERADLRRRKPAVPHGRAHRRVDRPERQIRVRCWRRWKSSPIEASIAKVAGSETLQFVLDENVQIHGGNGFVKDYPAERHYRDARVNRIFEGTNEINRLLIPGMLIRRALKGDLPLIPAARRLQDEILAGPGRIEPRGDDPLDEQRPAVQAFKKVALMTLGLAMQRYGEELTRAAGGASRHRRHRDRGRMRRKRAAAGVGRNRRRWRSTMSMRRQSSSTMRHHGSRRPPGRCSRPWPRAIPFERIWRR